MEPSSRAWVRRLTVAVALLVGLSVATLPVSAAPSTKNYSASLTYGTATGTTVTVPFGEQSSVTVTLTNQQESLQAFASAELTFASTAPTEVVVDRAGWEVLPRSSTQYRLVNTGVSNPVRPGGSLAVTVVMPGTPTGPTTVTTQVKQSNDFNGTNNDFADKTGDLTIVTAAPEGTLCTTTTCRETFPTSPENAVRADLTVTSASTFGYTAGFTLDRLTCDEIPFGAYDEELDAGVQPEPFQVDSDGTSPVSKRLVLTFPKALSNLVPDNGTPHHPVCAGGDQPFPGSSPTTPEQRAAGTATHPHEGLLLNCSDPRYVSAKSTANPEEFLPMCVASRARSAGKLVVTVLIEATTVDPRIW